MTGGLAGAIIVRDADTTSAVSTSYVSMASTIIVLQHVPLCSCNPTDDMFRITSIPHIMLLSGDDTALNYVQNAAYPDVTDVTLTNGQYQPNKALSPGEWHRFEFIAAIGIFTQR